MVLINMAMFVKTYFCQNHQNTNKKGSSCIIRVFLRPFQRRWWGGEVMRGGKHCSIYSLFTYGNVKNELQCWRNRWIFCIGSALLLPWAIGGHSVCQSLSQLPPGNSYHHVHMVGTVYLSFCPPWQIFGLLQWPWKHSQQS